MTNQPSAAPLPALFMGHGSPMNAIEANRWSTAWRELGASLPRPRAVLAISAHWYIGATAVTAMDRPRTIHDFFGFPQELYDLEYPAAGSPSLAEAIAELVKPIWVGLDHDSWGLDHGTWSVLTHLFPEADVPVVQLSIDATKPLDHHLALGAALAPVRRGGVMVVCSGNVVHNLGMLDHHLPERGFRWAEAFDDAVHEVLTTSPDRFRSLLQHDDFARSAPTPEHFLPLAYLAGMASAERTTLRRVVEGFSLGSLSMASYQLD